MKYLFLILTLLTAGLSVVHAAKYVEIAIPMRDGKALAADAYVTDSTVGKPTILVQTPYNKNFYRLAVSIPAAAGGVLFPYDTAHYNYVVVDWRGFYGSASAATVGYDRGLDGYDVVEWIAAQKWSDGKVGTWGPSALGAIQFMTARQHPPHLVCSVPLVKDFKSKYSDSYYGGEFRKEHVEALAQLGFTPVATVLAHPTNDLTWNFVETNSDYASEITVPMLLVSGWFDHFPADVVRAFDDLRSGSAAAVRGAHKLIMGPWLHTAIDQTSQGALDFPGAKGVANDAALRFFDYYLRGVDNGYPSDPVVRYYQMGTNQWRTAENWKGVATGSDTLWLGPAGTLVNLAPSLGSLDTFRYDPRDPSPAVGGSRFFLPGAVSDSLLGPQDQAPSVESRNDIRTYTTEVLQSDLVIDGKIIVELSVSSNRQDTDFDVRICDVYPDGRSMLITHGIRRMRFRKGYRAADTAVMIPGEIYSISVDISDLALTIVKGHRLRIDISSSCYPHFDVNPNNGAPLYTSGDTLVATNSIHYGGANLSRIILPVVAPTSGAPRQELLPGKRELDLTIGDPKPLLRSPITLYGE